MSDIACTLDALFVHPVKSCGGLSPGSALLGPTGLDLDRDWMVVDDSGEMLTQRELPRMALVQPTLKGGSVVLRAPGMLALHLSVDSVEAATRARVWGDVVRAYDMGDLAAQWFTDFLGRPARLVRFDPEERRYASTQWTGEVQAETNFADGFPLLVAGTESLGDFNRRLREQGQEAVTMHRFRPNLVLGGLPPWDEDHLGEIEISTDDGPVRLRLVKPCVRCSIPDVDPVTAATDHRVGDLLASFRADARMNGGLTFGMNAIVLEGFGRTLRVGQQARAGYSFD